MRGAAAAVQERLSDFRQASHDERLQPSISRDVQDAPLAIWLRRLREAGIPV